MKRISISALDAPRPPFHLLTHLVVFALLLSAPARAATRGLPGAQTSSSNSAEITAVVEDVPQLNRTIVDTPHGKFFLNFPKYATPGSEVSGTVFAEPAGQSPAEREKNAAVLKRYSIEIGGRRVEPNGTPIKVEPAVRDATNVVIHVPKDLKLKPLKLTLKPPDPPPTVPEEFSLPRYGQAGGFLAVTGPFDGDVADSDHVSVGGKQALTLAQSTTSMVVLNNSDFVGRTRIELREQGRVVSGDYRNLSVGIAVTKPTTSSGEASMLTVNVGGLEGLSEEIPLVLENRSAAIVRMERGEKESLTIRPADVRPGGTVTLTRKLMSLRPGAFSIHATVIAGIPPAPARRDGPGPQRKFKWYTFRMQCGSKEAEFTIGEITDGSYCSTLLKWVTANCDPVIGTLSGPPK